jgi:hypothetical protein
MRCKRKHTTAVFAVLARRREDQILRTVPILGGLLGGDSEVRMLLPNISVATSAVCSEIRTAGTARSPLRTFDTATTCGGTARLQHECEAGMVEVSHMLAIFRQQLCSSSVISRPRVTQATRGCPKSSSISTAGTSFEALFNILILPHRCNKIASNKVAFASLCLPGKAIHALNSLLLLFCGFGHVFMKCSQCVIFLGLFQR